MQKAGWGTPGDSQVSVHEAPVYVAGRTQVVTGCPQEAHTIPSPAAPEEAQSAQKARVCAVTSRAFDPSEPNDQAPWEYDRKTEQNKAKIPRKIATVTSTGIRTDFLFSYNGPNVCFAVCHFVPSFSLRGSV